MCNCHRMHQFPCLVAPLQAGACTVCFESMSYDANILSQLKFKKKNLESERQAPEKRSFV